MGKSFVIVTRMGTFAVLLATLASCGLPRSGPTRGELLRVVAEQTIPTHIVEVTEQVTQIIPPEPRSVFPADFVNAGALTPGLIRPGDTLRFTVFENVDDGLFSRSSGSSSIGALQVDEAGFIFVPYVGRVRAVGNSPERMRQIITERLSELTPRPQVIVQRTAGDGGTVSVEGNGISGQGAFPLDRTNLRLMGMLSSVGGIEGDPALVTVVVIRGRHRVEMSYEDIYDDPRYNIALRPGDRIIVDRDDSRFISLGASGTQGIVPFERKTVSALEAIAQVGGLNDRSADPTGVFVIRDEKPEIANAVLGRSDFATEQRFIYLIDLTQPSGLFLARNFNIQDGDTFYVTEAPFTQWTKTISAIIGTAGNVQTLDNIASGD